jgi:hypothetical protein
MVFLHTLSMRYALCLYGHLRTFDLCWPSLQENLIRPNNITDVFMTTWTDSMGFFQHPEQSVNPKTHRGYDKNSAIPTQDYIMTVLSRLNPQMAELPAFHAHEKKFDAMLTELSAWHHPSQHHRPKGTLGQVWGRCNSLRMKKTYEDQNRFRFDAVVVTRYDINYNSPIELQMLPKDCIVSDGMYGEDVVSDAWCCGPSDLCDKWAQQLVDIPRLVNNHTMNLGPHEWLKSHFSLNNIPWTTHGVGISIQR